MRNRMQDLDFEQTVAFDSVKDFEFTRKAAQKFRQVVSLDSFEDEGAFSGVWRQKRKAYCLSF